MLCSGWELAVSWRCDSGPSASSPKGCDLGHNLMIAPSALPFSSYRLDRSDNAPAIRQEAASANCRDAPWCVRQEAEGG